ncbi:hypothetical protein ACFL1G_12160 [Planctomycetota bacterium]
MLIFQGDKCACQGVLRPLDKHIYTDGKWDKDKVKDLDRELMRVIGWVEEDWDRNRFVNDPGKDGYALNFWGHTLYWLKMTHRVHEQILNGKVEN